MRRIARRLSLLASFVAIGFGVLFGKSGSWAMARYFQLAMPLTLEPSASAQNATVTVVMPAHNEAARIADAVESLKQQTYPLFRCIIVDDASTDETSQVAINAIAEDPRFTVIRLLRNSGLPAARNAGLATVSSEFVLFLDADDFLLPEAIAARIEFLRNDSAAAGSFGHALHVIERVNWRKKKVQTLDQAGQRLTLTSVDGESPFVIHQVLLRTRAALDIGGFDETLDRGCEDTEFWFRSLRSGHEYVDTQARDCLYVQRSGSMVENTVGHHVELYMRLVQANWNGESPSPALTCAHQVSGPLPDLIHQASLQKRAFKFLGMMATAEKQDEVLPAAMNDALSAVRVISNETAVEEMRLGAGRSLRRAGSQNPRLLNETVSAAAYRYRDVLTDAHIIEPLPVLNEPGWAILVCDETQLRKLDSALASLPLDSQPMILIADALTHDGGAAEAAGKTSKWPSKSVVKYLLQGCVYEVVLVPDDNCEAGEIVERAAKQRGSQVVKWGKQSNESGVSETEVLDLAVAAPADGVRRVPVPDVCLPTIPTQLVRPRGDTPE